MLLSNFDSYPQAFGPFASSMPFLRLILWLWNLQLRIVFSLNQYWSLVDSRFFEFPQVEIGLPDFEIGLLDQKFENASTIDSWLTLVNFNGRENQGLDLSIQGDIYRYLHFRNHCCQYFCQVPQHSRLTLVSTDHL
jgi:hypothetical protein